MSMKAINNTTQVRIAEQSLVKYEYRTWFIFGWYVKVSTKKIKNDLVINTTEEFDQVIINGKEYVISSSNSCTCGLQTEDNFKADWSFVPCDYCRSQGR